MGCFLGCFRIKDDGSRRCHLFSKFYSWKKKDLVLDRNQYISVVSSEERGSPPSEKAELEVLKENLDGDDSVHEKLRQEAKFLKTCGAILETPIEIRKASVEQYVASDPCCIKLNWDQHLEKSDDHPLVDPKSIFEEEKLKSYKRDQTNDERRKMVRFEESNHSVVEEINTISPLEISSQTENQMQLHGSESPYPTPINLVYGLQTPGTIYPPKLENLKFGMIRAQFVYPVPDQSQRSFELNVLCEDKENAQKVPPASQNSELRPPLPRDERKNNLDLRKKPSHSDKSPDEDRPIIGTAVADWNDEEPSRISPRQWDGNGIPNSTTKYKEDQKVSWHATPFEVRLEKALSEEKVYPLRKLDGRLVELEDEGIE